MLQVTGTHAGEPRRRIAPKLTCEFVNYFTGKGSHLNEVNFAMRTHTHRRTFFLSNLSPERLSRMRTFEEHQKGLQTTNSELKEEELRVKLQLAQVERELNSLRVLGHELKCQTTAIYTNITRITSKVTRQAPVVTCMCISIPVSVYVSCTHVPTGP